MIVRRVRPDRHMHRGRHAEPVARRQQAQPPVRQPLRVDHRPDRLAQPPTARRAFANGGVDEAVRLFGHAEGAVGERGGHVFRGAAHVGELEIMDHAGPVHGDGSDDLALDELQQERA